jgi:hypothetical protein
MVLSIPPVQGAGMAGGVVQYDQCLLVLAQFGLDQYAVRVVELAHPFGELQDFLPCGQVVRVMVLEPCGDVVCPAFHATGDKVAAAL